MRSPAGEEAAAAARAAGVTVRAAESIPELRTLVGVGEAVWGANGTLKPNEMRALAHAGGVVLGAFTPDEPVGFAIGFLGWNDGLHLHSHQTGVVPRRRGTGVGYALKLAQRAVCLDHGVAEMRWTFDPLVLRNTAFNLRRLGARAVRFVPDFYGEMTDSVNSNDLSDRLEAVWRLTDPLPHTDEDGDPRGIDARPAALVCSGGRPRETGLPPAAGDHVAVPGDYATMRERDPERARAWRLAVRRTLGAAYDAGLRIGRVEGDGYVLEVCGE